MAKRSSIFPLILILLLLGGLSLRVVKHDSSGGTLGDDASREIVQVDTNQQNAMSPSVTSSLAKGEAIDFGKELRLLSPDFEILAARMGREVGDLDVVEHADGRRSVSLKGRFHHMSAMVIGPDGKKQIRCFSNFGEMAEALTDHPPVERTQPPVHAR